MGVWVEDIELKLDKTGNTVSCYYKHISSPDWYHIGDATSGKSALILFYHVHMCVYDASVI